MSQKQYIRKFNLTVAGASGSGLDLSGLHVQFTVKKTDAQTPNTAQIRIFNIAPNTIAQIQREFTRVILQAGYESNYGVIFDGNIKQVRSGKQNGVDTFLDIAAGDGDDAYNFAVVSTTLAAGATQADQINAAAQPMSERNIKPGYIGDTGNTKLSRGKVMHGMSRDYLRQSAEVSDSSWSVQDGRLQVLPLTAVLPNQAVVLNSKTGLIGTPEQTNDGITAVALLNPLLKIGGKVKIDEASVQRALVPESRPDDSANKPASLASDGFYRLLAVQIKGDTRGNDWYSELTCLDIDETQPPSKQVKPV